MLNKLKSSQLIKDTITTTALNVIGRGTGFLVPFFIAAWFGISVATDAFFFAYGTILFFAQIFAPTVESLIVPFIADHRSRNTDIGEFVGMIFGNVIKWLSIFSLLLVFFGYIAIKIFTPFSAPEISLISQLLIETIPLIVLLTITSVFTGTLNAYKIFAVPAIAPAFRAVIIIALIYVLKRPLGIHSIALSYVIGELFRAIILYTLIDRLGLFKLRLSYSITVELKEFFRSSSFQIISMIAMGLSPIINKFMASWLKPGDISILEYADRLYVIPTTFFTSGLIITILSHWSSKYYQDKLAIQSSLRKTICYVIPIALLVHILCILLSKYAVQLVYAHNSETMLKLVDIRNVFLCMLFGFVPYILSQIYVRFIIVLKQTHILTISSVLSTFLNIIMNYFLMQRFGIVGIAISTACLSFFNMAYLGYYSHKVPKNCRI